MSEVECPYCEHTFNVCCDDGMHCDQDDYSEYECPACDKQMMIHTYVSVDHTAHPAPCLNADDPADADHDWFKVWVYVANEHYKPKHRCRSCGVEK